LIIFFINNLKSQFSQLLINYFFVSILCKISITIPKTTLQYIISFIGILQLCQKVEQFNEGTFGRNTLNKADFGNFACI
jgi:hypothetical protein